MMANRRSGLRSRRSRGAVRPRHKVAGPCKDHNPVAMTLPYDGRDMVGDLFAPLPRAALVLSLHAILGVTRLQADQIVEAFDDFVAAPLEANLKKRSGRDL